MTFSETNLLIQLASPSIQKFSRVPQTILPTHAKTIMKYIPLILKQIRKRTRPRLKSIFSSHSVFGGSSCACCSWVSWARAGAGAAGIAGWMVVEFSDDFSEARVL